MPPRESFGQTLKRIRGSRTQREVAKRIEMDFSYYSRLEGDRTGPPTRETIIALVKALEATEDDQNELMAAAGRVSEEMQEQPLLKTLYKAASRLPEEDLAELVRRAEEWVRENDAD